MSSAPVLDLEIARRLGQSTCLRALRATPPEEARSLVYSLINDAESADLIVARTVIPEMQFRFDQLCYEALAYESARDIASLVCPSKSPAVRLEKQFDDLSRHPDCKRHASTRYLDPSSAALGRLQEIIELRGALGQRAGPHFLDERSIRRCANRHLDRGLSPDRARDGAVRQATST